MSFSIQTNVNSLIAQENLRVNSNFQSQTIQRLTSGYRINQSGDDAAGLAIANKFRSDTAELTQGVRNANDGVAQLQIMDGGMNNIGKMLDRLKTLATQSASSTFTGDRSVLNAEYQTLVGEIDRQAQSIGLSTGGRFAANMGVYIGGGTTAGGAADTGNGTVTLDLANSTVDSKALGLRTADFEVDTKAGADIGPGSATSVATISTNGNNATADNGVATFNISGPGFAGVSLSVNINGLTDPKSVADNINAAIAIAGNTNTSFRDAGISATVKTASNGVERLVFVSTKSAFQVAGSTKTANALLGNFKTGATAPGEGADVGGTFVGGAETTATAAETVTLRVMLDGVNHDFSIGLTNQTAGAGLLGAVTAATDGTNTLGQLGITVTDATNKLQFVNTKGQSMNIQVAGDTGNFLGLGSWYGDFATNSYTGAAMTGAVGTGVMEFSINGGDKIAVSVDTTDATSIMNSINAVANSVNGTNASLKAAGIVANTANAGADLVISSGGVNFRVNLASQTAGTVDLKFDATGLVDTQVTSVGSADVLPTQNVSVDALGSAETGLGSNRDVFAFAGLRNTGDKQALSFSAKDANGDLQATAITLTTSNAATLEDAINAINVQLQSDPTLRNIVAVKELNNAGTADGIRFVSSLASFNVKLDNAINFTDANPVGLYDGTPNVSQKQGLSVDSSASGSMDISTIQGAGQAVVALGQAVQKLGSAQAAIGKGQNQLNYAIGLASSQISNFSSAQAQIRDTDVAAEAANLTKASVLQQASMAAMAQANSAPQAVLSLLKG